MYTYEFPKCCTALVLGDFQSFRYPVKKEGVVTDSYGSLHSKEQTKFIENIKKRLEKARVDGYAVVVATVSSDQTDVAEELTSLGFISSGWMKKTRHPETAIALLYFQLNSGD